MNDLRIEPLDPDDDEMFARWFGCYIDATRHDAGPAFSPFTLPEMKVEVREGTSRRHHGVVGLVGEEVVATGYLGMPLHDNTTSAFLEVAVAVPHRRRGHGTAVLEELEGVAAQAGRPLLNGEVFWSYERGGEGTGAPGVEFATARGYRLSLGDVQRDLALPVAEELLDGLADACAPHHQGYELRCWVGPVPDELAASWMALSSTLMTEAPTGDREIEAEAADVELLREREAVVAAQGRTRYHAVALDAGGEVVAYTDLATTVHEPGKAYQWGTLVRRDHRGHRLGTAVKVANLRQLQREEPDVRLLRTYNAEVNAHMIGVNELLGFVPTLRLGEFQKRLAG